MIINMQMYVPTNIQSRHKFCLHEQKNNAYLQALILKYAVPDC